jgi:AGZA family xanthine/uracil permease-like MFS transporter
LFVDFFDTAGTLTSVANLSGKIDKNGNVENIDKAVFSDSIATIIGSIFGTSSTTSYIESGAGIKEGGKTGLVAVTVGVFFLLCLFLAPLAKTIPAYATGAALVFIATFFCRNLVNLDWDDISEYSPALLAAFIMPLTYSISNGIALAFIVYVLVKVISGKMSDLNPAVLIIAGASLLHFLPTTGSLRCPGIASMGSSGKNNKKNSELSCSTPPACIHGGMCGLHAA